jgi:NAD(P)-dependent dehydrogenase (short-subunit alcohol dehydrogenase family)
MATGHEGRRVVVCGGSRGIGRSIALGFAKAGAHVSICARGAETLEKTKSELQAAGAGTMHAAHCDLSSAAEIGAYIPAAAAALGGIDCLINNRARFESSRALSAEGHGAVDHQRDVDLGLPAFGAHVCLWRGQGRGDALHNLASGGAGAPRCARQFSGARLDRVSRWHLGRAQGKFAAALQCHSQKHSVWTSRAAGGSCRRGVVPRLASRALGDRASDRDRWRAVVGGLKVYVFSASAFRLARPSSKAECIMAS